MFKRKSTERKVEAKRASSDKKTSHIISSNIKDIVGAKLGIQRAGRNMDKIRYEINRNRKNLKLLKITESDLKELGIE